MVRLLSLQAHNFKKLRFDSPVQFYDGITLIAGLNESGKSSVLDAILYALFGRVTRPPRAKNEDLVSYGANEASVGLDFEVSDRKFRVIRQLHKTKPARASLGELTSSGLLNPLATGQEKVNEEIVKLLGGITYNEILSSTVVAQKELNKLIGLHKDDRRKIVNAFLNLESFNDVLAELGEERKDLEGTGARAGRVQAETEKLGLLKQELTQFNQTAEEKTRLLQDNASMTETNKDLQAKFQEKDRLYKGLSSFEAALRKKETLTMELVGKKQLYADQGSRAQRLRKEVEGVEQELSKFADYEKTEPLLQKMQTQLETAKTFSHEVAATERSWQTLQNEVAEAEQKLPPEDHAKIRKDTVQLQKPILPFGLASVLIFAGAVLALVAGNLLAFVFLALAGLVPLAIVLVRVGAATSAARHQSILGDLRYLEHKRHELARTEERRKQIAEEYESRIAGLTNLCENLPAYGDVFRSHRSHGIIEAAQFALQTVQGDKQSRETLRVKLHTVRNEMNTLPSETVLTGLANEISDLERRLNELVFPSLPDGIVFTPELSSATLAERDQLGRLMTATQTKIDQNLQRIIGLDKYLTEHGDIMSKVQLQEDVVRKLEHQLNVVRKALDGIQATAESLRNRVRPSVQGYMGSILPALTSSRYRAAILDDDYNLQVWDPEAGEYKPREVFSGGTEDQFLLAMRLAFALALLPEVKGQKPEFVFLDEPLGSSDDIRRSGIVEYLALDLSKKFKQIFIISHVGGLEDHVQNVIAMDEGRVARVESA